MAETWQGAIVAFDAHLLELGRSYSQRKAHRSYLRRFAADHEWLGPWEVSPDHVAR